MPILSERIRRATVDDRPVVHKLVTAREAQHHLAAAGLVLGSSDIDVVIAQPITRTVAEHGVELTYPDHGDRTVQDLPPSRTVRASRHVCRVLKASGVMWLDCAPKNMLLVEHPDRRIVLVDFDHGLAPAAGAPSPETITRCIQLAEEFSPLRRSLYPFWPGGDGGLHPDELRSRTGSPAIAAIPIGSVRSRRLRHLAEALDLADPLADHQLLRLWEIFGALTAGTRDLELLSAWDHVARSQPGTEVRTTFSLLAHHAHHQGHPSRLRDLDPLIKRAATTIRTASDPSAASARFASDELAPCLKDRARQMVGAAWRAGLARHGHATVNDPSHTRAPRSLVLA